MKEVCIEKISLIIIANYLFSICIFILPITVFFSFEMQKVTLSIVGGILGMIMLNAIIIFTERRKNNLSIKEYMVYIVFLPVILPIIVFLLFIISIAAIV